MNPLIYVISIIIGICILYHFSENLKNLWGIREGFVNLTGKDLSKTGRCANYKVNGTYVRDGQYSDGCPTKTDSLEDCANMFGEEGGVFSYNPNNGGCLYTKTNEPHLKSTHSRYSPFDPIKGITSGCKPEYWSGGWKFYQAIKASVPSNAKDKGTIVNFFPPHTFPKSSNWRDQDSRAGTVSGTLVKGSAQEFWTPEKTIPTDSGPPYILQFQYQVNDQGWGNQTRSYLYLQNITKNKRNTIYDDHSRGTSCGDGVKCKTNCGKKDISQWVSPGDKIKLMFWTGRYNSGHSLEWRWYRKLNLTYNIPIPPIPSKRLSNHRQPTTTVYNTITGNCMPSTTLILIGKNPRKPQRNTILKEAKQWDGKWDNFVMSFVIKPLGKGTGSWQNIIHNTFDGMNSNNSDYSRWPGIWIRPDSGKIKLHIKWSGNQGTDPSYELQLNKKYRVTLIIDGSKYTCIIRDENDVIKHEQSETLGSGHSPPSKNQGDGSTIPLIEYGADMEKMPTNPKQTKLGECEGDCDSNNDCQTGMKCFERTGGQSEVVPGCRGKGTKDWDYCYYKDSSTLPFFYMSDPWYPAFNCEISELILDSNVSQPTCKLLEKQPKPTTQNAFYFACQRLTFIEHHNAAIAMGGHLASIHSAEENEAIQKILPPCQKVWIGAVRKRPGGIWDTPNKWAWSDGSKWDYTNWRRGSGQPSDFKSGHNENMGEVHAEIQKKDGNWRSIQHKWKDDVTKLAAVYKLKASFPVVDNIRKLTTDGRNDWKKSKELCEGKANSGNVSGSIGTLPSSEEIYNYIKAKPLKGDKWSPVSDGENVWYQVGRRLDRSGITPSFGLIHQEIPDVAYTKSGNAAKPTWGVSNKQPYTFRNALFCKKPPDGMTWDKAAEKWVPAKTPESQGLPSGITNVAPPSQSGTTNVAPNAIIQPPLQSGTKNLPVNNPINKGFKSGQQVIIIGPTPSQSEQRTIVGIKKP